MSQPTGPALGNYGNNAAIPGQGLESASFDLLRYLWRASHLPGLRKCHKVRYGPLTVKVGATGAWFEGFCRCHSVWACPVCAPGIRRGYALDLRAGLVRHVLEGGGLLFVVLTLPHDQGDRLGPLFSAVAEGWRTVSSTRAFKAFRKENPFEFVRSAEITHGANGFHPHLNVVFATERPLERGEVLALRGEIFDPWCSSVKRAGYRVPDELYGIELKRCDAKVAEYAVKVDGMADELTAMGTKTRSKRTEPMFSVLRRAAGGDPVAGVVWAEYELATKGRRALTFSRGFRDALGLGGELSDDAALELAQGRGVVAGTAVGYTADMIVHHPRGFEIVLEAVGSSTGQGWDSALSALRATLPWSVRADLDYRHFGDVVGPEPEPVSIVVKSDSGQLSLGDLVEVGF